ncbi:DUF4192 domain-containing protein [Luteimicrobium subarcticum]|uniref:Uncharacterized protein DUF4192 n=1 Tax=Luteimicrobium subarcticum TaxID=620910 RepID=A0A2M8WRD6_9MICO|nr:DUF4192 domain-containing protein [Luteimicrobium subarcticum]PJI93501.1 uncharacterized protein DUF4192 [Luteimicrobium subarcticum]
MEPHDDTLTVSVRDPRDLLAYVPYRLGFRPRDSAVVVSLRPPRSRVGLVVRVDLADLLDVRRGRPLARTVAHHLARDGAERIVVVAYADRVDDRVREALDVLDDELAVTAPVTARWAVTATGWSNPDCDDPTCCPPGGHPLAELDASPVAAELVLAGVSVAASRDHAYALPVADEPARRSARRAAGRWSTTHGRPPLTADARSAGLAAWRAALDLVVTGADVPAPAAGRVLAALEDSTVRDAALLCLVPDAGDHPERLAAADGPGLVGCEPATVDALARIIGPRGEAPEADLVEPVRRLLTTLAAHAAGTRRAPVLTLLGFLAWWTGDGGLARARVDAALAVDGGHRLAVLLSQMLDAGMPPGWVRAEHALLR